MKNSRKRIHLRICGYAHLLWFIFAKYLWLEFQDNQYKKDLNYREENISVRITLSFSVIGLIIAIGFYNLIYYSQVTNTQFNSI